MRRLRVFAAAVAAVVCAAPASAGEFSFSAKVDKTSVEVGGTVTLVLSLTGDIAGIELPKVQFPEGVVVGATSQSTNFSLQHGAMQRSLGLTYILLLQREGTLQLGPFAVTRGKEEFRTESIQITVTKSATPPNPAPEGERFLL